MRFRIGLVVVLIGIGLTVRLVKAVLWADGGHAPSGGLEHVVSWAGVTWALLVPWAVADVVGWLLYRRHNPATEAVATPTLGTMPYRVVFRIVTRGDQPGVVVATVTNILDTMARRPLFAFDIEVVTDRPIFGLPSDTGIHQLVVPVGYQTPNGATFKARALHYALETSSATVDAWILHLDEESHITEPLVVGIRNAVAEEESSGAWRIGQGLILYHRDLASNPVFTLADSIRVGDDLGRFHLQYRLHRVLFGMHGSFILVRNNVEQQVGFDFEPGGCITEDSTWGLSQMGVGSRFRWVDGHVVEQSPRRLSDFLKQRRRWFTGMWWAALHAPVALRHRSSMLVSMVLWTVAWFNLTYTWIHLFSGVRLPWGVALLGEFVFTVYVANYLLGLWITLTDRPDDSPLRKGRYFVIQLLLLPVHALIEAGAIVYALLRPATAFHVVEK